MRNDLSIILRVTLGLFLCLALVSIGPKAEARICGKQCKEANRYCQNWERRNPGQNCRTVRGVACAGRKWRKIKQVNALWSACREVSRRAGKDRAEARCRVHRRRYREDCRVVRRVCGPGWAPIRKYGRYTACRRSGGGSRSAFALYRRFFAILAKGTSGRRLKAAYRDFVRGRYRLDVNRVRIAFSRRVPNNVCITDCYRIYCGSAARVRRATRGRLVERIILHELAHTEQCRARGRQRYADMWFGQLPGSLRRSLANAVRTRRVRGLVRQIHGNMPMERAAQSKAQRLWPALRGR
jgi:hypothetical protein